MEERKNRVIISVSRQFGSGGHKIAEALAEHFELPIYDHRMLDSIAKEKGVDPRVLEKYDEKPLNRFLARNVSGFSSSLENNLAQMQFSYLKDKADSGESFVVVGRCAETVLKEYDGLITIFVLGDEETRVFIRKVIFLASTRMVCFPSSSLSASPSSRPCMQFQYWLAAIGMFCACSSISVK